MPQIGKIEKIHVELCEILPYWKKFLKEMHARGILYSYATEKEKLMVLNKVRKEQENEVSNTQKADKARQFQGMG